MLRAARFRLVRGSNKISVSACGFEFIIAVAIALPRPAKCLAADLAAADPHEGLVGGKCVRILVVVYEELVAVLVTGVAEALHGLLFEHPMLVAKTPEFQLIRQTCSVKSRVGTRGRPAS